MIFTKKGYYYNIIDMYVEEGYINIIFERELKEDNINEAFNINVKSKNGKNSVNIYIRNKSEGYGGDMPHWTTVKAQLVDNSGRKIGPQIPYSVPQKEGEVCELSTITKSSKNFDRDYGEQVKAFVDHSYELINKYWNADTDKLDDIEREIRNKYKRYQNLKRRGRIHNN